MTTAVVGGLRDRMVSQCFKDLVEDILRDMGWFSINPGWLDANGVPYTMPSLIPGPVPPTAKIEFNTVAITFEDVDVTDMEIGSTAEELTHVVYIDVYGQDEAIAKHIVGDIRDGLRGQLPDIGRTEPVLLVYDVLQATPSLLFGCDLLNISTARVHRTGMEQPWQRYWFTCRCDVTEERP